MTSGTDKRRGRVERLDSCRESICKRCYEFVQQIALRLPTAATKLPRFMRRLMDGYRRNKDERATCSNVSGGYVSRRFSLYELLEDFSHGATTRVFSSSWRWPLVEDQIPPGPSLSGGSSGGCPVLNCPDTGNLRKKLGSGCRKSSKLDRWYGLN
jgi:hypothetical protein